MSVGSSSLTSPGRPPAAIELFPDQQVYTPYKSLVIYKDVKHVNSVILDYCQVVLLQAISIIAEILF